MNLYRKIVAKIKSEPVYLYIFVFFVFLLFSSIFRDAVADEAYYLKETNLIAELLKNHIWIGNYGVGLHGFLFKLPVAIAFIVLGRPSVFVATLFTIILSIVSLILFYKIVKEFFLKDRYSFWATVLLSVTFHFINTSLSFNRDIPAVFTVLLFFFFFLKNKNSWLIGLSFLLMLDAKEHVFLTIAPLYAIYLLMNEIQHFKKAEIWNGMVRIFRNCVAGYTLPLIWIFLMFTTSIIPINMFVASITGLTEVGLEWSKSQFSTEVASQNFMGEEGKEISRLSNSSNKIFLPCKNETEVLSRKYTSGGYICTIIKIVDTIGAYSGKFLYPRTFSFISIPKIIVLPSLLYSISLFITWFKKKDKKYILPMILFFNVLVVTLRASHGRYLLGVSPIFMLFFVMFIRDCIKKPKYFKNILIATTVFVLLGLLFESTFVNIKIILEMSLLILLWAIWFFRLQSKRVTYFLKVLFFSALSMGMFLTALAFSFEIGQLSGYQKFGYNRETKQIVKELRDTEKIWINDYGSGDLINMYRNNLFNEPEWTWEIPYLVPKKSLLRTYGENNTFTSSIIEMESFKKEIESNNINKVVIIVSTLKSETFPNENKLTELLSQDWLKYEGKIKLKNKDMHIFKFRNEMYGND